ncbi:hypothetical protein [Alkalihalobacillus sp. CinArs1]|uniref:hypothetical protein n=1 Tax=Alkalihalobacillus sp. CinArs1 TaxID=2995314 RepID=UPI0022DDC4B3|nr:hypothetical protein [Alkalihalobacillus sp. CinArs1]
MNKVMNIVLLLACIVVIILGKSHWESRATNYEGSAGATEVSSAGVKDKGDNKNQNSEGMNELASNLPTELTKAIENGELPVKVEAVGSAATSEEAVGWPAVLQENLDNTYGDGVFELTVKSFGDKTSDEVVQEITASNVDVLLLEPFLLKNNGIIRIEDSLEITTNLINKYKKVNEDVTIMLQPSNPLYDATYYPLQIEDLESFASDHDYIYLDHWEAWPALDDEKMNEYLTDKSEPNEMGHNIWAQYLTSYFTGN